MLNDGTIPRKVMGVFDGCKYLTLISAAGSLCMLWLP